MSGAQLLAAAFCDSLAATLQLMTGAAVTAREPEPGARQAGLLWWEHEYGPGSGWKLWVGADEACWSAVGIAILAAAGLGEEDAQETYLEAVRQAFSGLSRQLPPELGAIAQGGAGRESEPPPGAQDWSAGVIFEGRDFPFCVAAEGPADAAESNPTNPGQDELAGLDDWTERPLDLLMDVELPVRVSFGKTELAIRDILKLTTGSIVELNRLVHEPVNVMVNNCLIARGEVVVVEGNYGVRIQEILHRRERLRSVA